MSLLSPPPSAAPAVGRGQLWRWRAGLVGLLGAMGSLSIEASATAAEAPAVVRLEQQAAKATWEAARDRRLLRGLADDFAQRIAPHTALLARVDHWLAAGNRRAASLAELVAWRPAVDQAERTAAACTASWQPLQAARPADETIWDVDPTLAGQVRWACARLTGARAAMAEQFTAAAALLEGFGPAWSQLPQRYAAQGRIGFAQWQAVVRLDQTMAERIAVLQPVADALGLPVPTSVFAEGVAAKEALLGAMARGQDRWALPEGSEDRGFARHWAAPLAASAQQGPFAGKRTLVAARWSPGPWQPLLGEGGKTNTEREVQLLIRDSASACWLVWATARQAGRVRSVTWGDDIRLIRCPR